MLRPQPSLWPRHLACVSGHRRDACAARRGAILVVALGIITVLAGLVLVFARAMRVEAIASANTVAAIQTDAIERAAEQYVIALIASQQQYPDYVLTLTEDYFQACPVGDQATDGGKFWIVRPNYDDSTLPLYGVVDESSKLNINNASLDALNMMFSSWDPDVPPSIIDWRDTDDNMTDGGAESDYYMSMAMPYMAKNAPFETVEELLLVKGVYGAMLYGTNQNTDPPRPYNFPMWNWQLGSNSITNSQPLFSDPTVTHGLYDYLTVYSSEPNNSISTGQARINVNDANARNQLSTALTSVLGASGQAVINRLFPPAAGGGRGGPGGARGGAALGVAAAAQQFASIFDVYLRSGLSAQEFDQIADLITTSTSKTLKGRININTAPREVLLCLPGITEADVEAIVAHRQQVILDPTVTSIAWVADILGARASAIGNLITAHSYQYTADIVAVSGNGRAFKRFRVVIDASTTPPHVIYRRDITQGGWPLDPQLLQDIRNGVQIDSPTISTAGSLTR